MKIRCEIDYQQKVNFFVRGDKVLTLGAKLCVLIDEVLKREILNETHNSIFVMHHGSTKMYRTLRDHY